MRTILALVALFFVSVAAADEQLPKELYMPNEAGGFVVLTVEPCTISGIAERFPNRAYATETVDENSPKHEGCWDSPSIADAPDLPGVKIIPIVNAWFDNEVHPYQQTQFTPDKKRYEEIEQVKGIAP